MFLHPFYVSLLPKKEKKKKTKQNKTKQKLDKNVVLVSHNSQTWRTYTQRTNTNQIKQYHQSTNHRPIKNATPKPKSKYCPPQPLATNIDENHIVNTMDKTKVWSREWLLLNQMDLEASIKNRRSPCVNGFGRFS